jgi:phosphoserine phosphatase RsbU/P
LRISIFTHSTAPHVNVWGDFYDFLLLGTGEWMGVLADVSGKGISAALLSSMVLGALSMEFHAGTEPELALSRVNCLLCEKSLPGQFVTLFLFLLSSDGTGRFLSAGHNPVYLFRAATGKVETLRSNSFFLGMFEGASFESQPLRLDKGDVLLVYSDGLTDAQNPRGDMFGEGRLLSLIRQEAASGSHALEQRLLGAVANFTQGTPQTDDITFVIVGRR